MKIYHGLIAGLLAMSPLTTALAQGSTSPNLKAGSATEADSVKKGTATDPQKPGATGSTVVPGNKSTAAGASAATGQEKTGGGSVGDGK